MCKLHLSGREYESLGKPMVVDICGVSLKQAHATYQAHERKRSEFPKSEVFLLVYLALLNSMCFAVFLG